MLCHQRAQLHSAYTVLDGGCCLFFPFSWMKSVRFFESWEWYGDGLLVRHEWETEWANALRERELERKCAMPKSDMMTVRRTCVSECEQRQRVFFSVGPSEGHSFTFFRPSCSVYLPPFSDIAIIFKELHLKKKITQKKRKDICSGMFKWSTKYLCSCLIWCECCVWCVFYLAVTELICVNVMWCCLWAGLWEWAVNEGERELWVA